MGKSRKPSSIEKRVLEIIDIAREKKLEISREQLRVLLNDLKKYTKMLMNKVYAETVKRDKMKELYDLYQIILNSIHRGKYSAFTVQREETIQTIAFVVGEVKISLTVPNDYNLQTEPDYGVMGLQQITNPDVKMSFTSSFAKVLMLTLLPFEFNQIHLHDISSKDPGNHLNENKSKMLIPMNYLNSIHERIQVEMTCPTCGEKICQ